MMSDDNPPCPTCGRPVGDDYELPPFGPPIFMESPMEDATWWVQYASLSELKAYFAAIVRIMPKPVLRSATIWLCKFIEKEMK